MTLRAVIVLATYKLILNPRSLSQMADNDVASTIIESLCVGPYVCAEWSFGGLPVWLMNITRYPAWP
jgi:hypothetical protein